MPRPRLPLSLCAVLPLLLTPRPARACGGFFCQNIPVDQTGEKIAFVVDHDAGSLEAIIQISYQGAAEEFAWILPLATAPSDVQVATSRTFQGLDRLTQPSFALTWDLAPTCRIGPQNVVDASAGIVDASTPDGGSTVVVLREEAVGPYDTVVLSSADPEATRAWLTSNGFRVTDAMMELVVPYLAQGDVLMALKLRQGVGTAAIQPIALELRTTEACVPLRMTAIAAIDDMEVVAYVLSARGRAIPQNYLHIEPNWAKLNWFSAAGAYRTLISQAFDEAGGNAFVTEYAGSADGLRSTVYRQGEYDLRELAGATTLLAALDAVARQSLTQRPESRGILRTAAPDALLREHGIDPDRFWTCALSCYTAESAAIPLDGAALAAVIEERILAPDRRVQASLDHAGRTLTRLRTFISPSEMNLDPIFAFRPDLPAVSNVHRARVIARCGADGLPLGGKVQVELPDGSVVDVDYFTGQSSAFQTPSALEIGNLADGTVVVDNRPMVQRSIVEQARQDGCGCTSARGAEAGALAALCLLALGASRLRGKRR